MKTFRILSVAVFLFIGIGISNAQIVQSRYDAHWETVFYCEGVLKDFIWGTASFTEIKSYDKQGNLLWNKLILIGQDFNSTSGEIYKVTYTANQEDYNPGSTLTWKFTYNLTGDQGTKYKCLVTYEVEPTTGYWNLISKIEECL
jgi:hypothetical protein